MTKGADAPAHTLNLIWKQVFGSMDLWLEKQQLKRTKELEDFGNRLNEKLKEIPKEEIQEPKFSVLGPAIEASQYYLEEEELREIFAKLVSASFDARQNGKLHNSFVDKIKSLSSHDAKLLQNLKESIELALGEYYIEDNNNAGEFTLSPIVCLAMGEENIEKTSVSIDNLVHLGLIQVDMGRHFTDEARYREFYSINLFDHLNHNNHILSRKLKIEELLKSYSKERIASANHCSVSDIENWLQDRKVSLRKGICKLTSLGKVFVEICC